MLDDLSPMRIENSRVKEIIFNHRGLRGKGRGRKGIFENLIQCEALPLCALKKGYQFPSRLKFRNGLSKIPSQNPPWSLW